MSSTTPLPLRMSISVFSTSMMSDVSPLARSATWRNHRCGAEVQLVVEDAGALHFLAADAAVELHAADRRQVVALGGEEQVVEQVLGRILASAARPDASCGRSRPALPCGSWSGRCAACRR